MARASRKSGLAQSVAHAALVALTLGSTVPARSLPAQHALTALPIGDPAYTQLTALDRLGCAAARVSAHRPYLVRDVQRAVTRITRDSTCVGAIAHALADRFARPTSPPLPPDVAPDLAAAVREAAADTLDTFRVGAKGTLVATTLARGEFRPLWRGVRDRDEGTPPLVANARVRVGWASGERLAAVAEAVGQTSRRNDPTVRQRALRNTSGFVDFGESYINAQFGRLDASFGRSWAAWMGEGTESLALSAHGPLIDRLELGLRWRVAETRALVAAVNDVTMSAAVDSLAEGTPDTRFRRWLYAHVLTIRPTDRVELTLGETLISSRTSRGFDLAYANPLQAYIVTQNDTGRVGADPRDNLVVFGGARVAVGQARVGAELVVDDIQIDAADRARTADQLAWRAYVTAPVPVVRATSVGAEYRRVGSYTYLRDFYTDVYQNYDQPLGSALGPDADIARLFGEHWPRGELRLSAGIGYWRQGALRIDQRPSEGPNDNAGRPYPTTSEQRPEVQTAVTADLEGQLLSLRLPVALKVELARIQNAANRPGAAALYVRAVLAGSYAFRYP